MNKLKKGENSVKLAELYRDIRITAEELGKHKNIMTKECRKYLIGKTCAREKNNRVAGDSANNVYARIGGEFGYKAQSMPHIISYAYAIDEFYKIAPDIAEEILSGRIRRLSGENAIILSKMDINAIRIIIERLISENTPVEIIFKDQKRPLRITKREKRAQKAGTVRRKSVKDTPTYDPNAQVEILAYTIPSWINAIENNFMNTNFNEITLAAQRRLIKELNGLKDIAATMISILRDEK